MSHIQAISFVALGLEIEKAQSRILSAPRGIMERRVRLEKLLQKFRELQLVHMPLTRNLLPTIFPYALPEHAPVLLPSSLRPSERAGCTIGLQEIEIGLREDQSGCAQSRLRALEVRIRALQFERKWGAGGRLAMRPEMARVRQAMKEERDKLDVATKALRRLRSESEEEE
ncbi:hypothetical protein C8R43DRAFT_1122449 [Mycena crocata]|nr:hypothetical protein C8R43DRAFT_1122449 [Mycena crocata]